MTLQTQDTIAALATPSGAGGRAVVRVSGAEAWRVAVAVCGPSVPRERPTRLVRTATLALPGLHSSLSVDVYFWHGPHSYTGQDVLEFHLLSSLPLVETLMTAVLDAGARAARPGEFTQRAFLAGKLDLTRAEAVLAVIDAADQHELKQALVHLAGGVARPMQVLREDLLNLLADVEAGLDFADEDIAFVGEDEQLKRIGYGLARLTLLARQVGERGLSDRPFRIVFAGRPNAGKSSLFNALVGKNAALVSPQAGTTRDYVVEPMELGGVRAELVDTAGRQTSFTAIETRAVDMAIEQAGRADLILLCVEAGSEPTADETATLRQKRPPVLGVATKSDLAAAGTGFLATSALTGFGLGLLRSVLAERTATRSEAPLAPSLSRCRHHVEACLAGLRRAHTIVLERMPPELLALELRSALDQLGEMAGAVYTDDLLDRVFSRFCIGK
jgi:tRNA modification GTPase